MPGILYDKLVRDKIPQIIERSGHTPVWESLPHIPYIVKLEEKLAEELAEYQKSKDIEELADLLEVIYSLAEARGYTLERLDAIRRQKAADRGGFEKKILLREVIEE